MAADEDMAVSFYKAGNPADLADKLVAILQSPELQRQLAEHNFSAAMRMTMPSVVRHYLRWFELSRHRQTVNGFVRFPRFQSWHPFSQRSTIFRQAAKSSWGWTLQSDSGMGGGAGAPNGRDRFEETPAAGSGHRIAGASSDDLPGSLK